MILQRVLAAAAAAGAALAGAGVVVVALAFALYAFAKTYVGPAGASAITALVVAAALGVGFLLAASKARGPKRVAPKKAKDEPPQTLLERALDTARERPFVAAAGAVAAGLLALRNPALVATVLGLINQPQRPRRS